MESTKEKIDRALGIADGQSIDDFLDGVSSDFEKTTSAFDALSREVDSSLAQVDQQIGEIQSNPCTSLTISDLDASMREVEDLIKMSKQMFKHIYENIVSSELVDSELVGSVSKLLESIHINIAEFISLYRDKMKYVEKMKMMLFQQNLKKELMDKKHQQDLEKMKMKAEQTVIDTTGNSSGGSMSQEEAIKLLSKMTDSQMDGILGIPSDEDVQLETKDDEEATSDEEKDKTKISTIKEK